MLFVTYILKIYFFFCQIDCLADVFVKFRDKLSEHDNVAAEAEEYMKKKNILKKYFIGTYRNIPIFAPCLKEIQYIPPLF